MRCRRARYAELFHKADLAGVTLPAEPAGFTHTFNQYTVRMPNRDAVRDRLTAEGIGTEVYYPVPFHRQPCFASLGYPPSAFPHADRAAATSLSLPIYGELTEAQQATVVGVIAAAAA
jgi:dTDP-4-amino-4,6-dideoxygalactose transaminase